MVVNREEILLALYNRETFPEPENSVRKALGIKDKKAVNICVATSVAISFGDLMHAVLKKDKFASIRVANSGFYQSPSTTFRVVVAVL